MNRYFYELEQPKSTGTKQLRCYVYDRAIGCTPAAKIAIVREVPMAERIVLALNRLHQDFGTIMSRKQLDDELNTETFGPL